MAGHFNGQEPWRAQHYPDKPQFSGFMYPCRFEGEVQNLAVRGSIPDELDGVFYRVMPDPALPPLVENDPVSVPWQPPTVSSGRGVEMSSRHHDEE